MEAPVDMLLSPRALRLMTCPEHWLLTGPAWSTATTESLRHRAWMSSHQQTHSYLEMLLVLEGKGIYGIGGRQYRYRPGSVLVLPPHVERDLRFAPWMRSLTRLWISITSDVTVNLYAYHNGQLASADRHFWFFPLTDIGVSPQLIAAACDMTAHSNKAAQRLRIMVILSAIIARLMEPSRSLADEAEGAIQRQRIDAVRRHIEMTGGRGIHLQDLARMFDISPFHLLRSFKRQEGCTIHQFVDRCRLLSLHTLNTAGVPRKVIARELGFSGLTTFGRWERRMKARPSFLPHRN